MENDVQLVACKIGGEEYAVEINNVQEIIRVLHITRVPNSLPYMSGVINLRGMVIPLMDLRKRFNLPENEFTDSTRIIISVWQGTSVGMLVDGVSEVIWVSRKAIEDPASFSVKADRDFFDGIGKLNHRVLSILNLDKVLNSNMNT